MTKHGLYYILVLQYRSIFIKPDFSSIRKKNEQKILSQIVLGYYQKPWFCQLTSHNESPKEICLILNNLYIIQDIKNNMEMVVNNKIGTYVSCCFLKEIQTLFHLNRKWYPKVFSDVHVKSISMAPASRNFCFCAWMWTTSNIVLQVPFHTGCEGYQSKKPGTGNQKPETRNQEPGTRNQEPETRNQKPGTRNQKPGTRDQESETKNWNLKTPMLLLLCLDVNNLEYCITSSITHTVRWYAYKIYR